MSDQVLVSYVSMEYETLLPMHKIIMPSCHNNSLYAMLKRNTLFLDLVHCVINHAMTLELEYDVQFLQV